MTDRIDDLIQRLKKTDIHLVWGNERVIPLSEIVKKIRQWAGEQQPSSYLLRLAADLDDAAGQNCLSANPNVAALCEIMGDVAEELRKILPPTPQPVAVGLRAAACHESEGTFLRRIQYMLESVDWEGDEGPNNDDLNRLNEIAWRDNPQPVAGDVRDWSKIRDYFDCLGDTDEEKKLRIQWVREMKAENKELRDRLSLLRPVVDAEAVRKLADEFEADDTIPDAPPHSIHGLARACRRILAGRLRALLSPMQEALEAMKTIAALAAAPRDGLIHEAYQLIYSAHDGGIDEMWMDAAGDWIKELRDRLALLRPEPGIWKCTRCGAQYNEKSVSFLPSVEPGLRSWLRHHDDCPARFRGQTSLPEKYHECTCGLEAALATAPRKEQS